MQCKFNVRLCKCECIVFFFSYFDSFISVIMKKKTLVCQFASPLDVDLHSKPESVVLEGKYWKRQFGVIKAEYMKWRKFYRNRGLGTNAILDTVQYNCLNICTVLFNLLFKIV